MTKCRNSKAIRYRRNIIWFNPQYSKTENIHWQMLFPFPPEHEFHKTFHRNTLKLSYPKKSSR